MLKKVIPIQQDPKGKWAPNWQGPYVVKKAFSRGALILTEMDGEKLSSPINFDAVKKYYAWVELVRKWWKKWKWIKNEESNLKIQKGQLGFNGGYSSWKPVKYDWGRGRKPQKAIQLMKSFHQRVEVESKILFGRIKIIGHDCLLK